MLSRMLQKRWMDRVWKKGSSAASSASLLGGSGLDGMSPISGGRAVVVTTDLTVVVVVLSIDSGGYGEGSGDDRPSHSSKPSVGLSGRMMGSSQKATLFLVRHLLLLLLLLLGGVPSREISEARDGAGEDMRVEAVESEEPSDPDGLRSREAVSRDDGRLMSSSACLARSDATR